MLLSILERFRIIQFLPRETTIVKAKLTKSIESKIDVTLPELKEVNFKNLPDGRAVWGATDPILNEKGEVVKPSEKIDIKEKEFELTIDEIKLIKEIIEDLDKKNKFPLELIPLSDKIDALKV